MHDEIAMWNLFIHVKEDIKQQFEPEEWMWRKHGSSMTISCCDIKDDLFGRNSLDVS